MTPETIETDGDIKSTVREKYGQAAQRVMQGETDASCCGSSGCCGSTTEAWDPITVEPLRRRPERRQSPPKRSSRRSAAATRPRSPSSTKAKPCSTSARAAASTSCCRRSASVRPARSYGLDMTDEMLALANENKRKAGADNVEFLKGEIEHIPLPDNSVDVIISNCVINLSADKARVLREAFRVLKPGGRFAVSDVVVRGETPDEVRRNMELWIGCVAGALEEIEYRDLLADVGFRRVEIEPTRSLQGRRRRRVSRRERTRSRDVRHADRRQVHERVRARGEADTTRRKHEHLPTRPARAAALTAALIENRSRTQT